MKAKLNKRYSDDEYVTGQYVILLERVYTVHITTDNKCSDKIENRQTLHSFHTRDYPRYFSFLDTKILATSLTNK